MAEIRPTALPDILEICPRTFADNRGWFRESWNHSTLADAGITIDWVQDNESFSAMAGTVRGLHLQTTPHAQDKLVRCVQGSIFDVAIDLRGDSPTYRHWVGVHLSAAAGNQLLIPKGFGHGFCTLEADCLIQYKVSARYVRESELTVAWDDPDLRIDWPVTSAEVTLSDKDAEALPLASVAELLC